MIRTHALEIERKLNITVTLPLTCHFCGEEIVKKYGREARSLLFHSLDENHDNWDPENKRPVHKGCHNIIHHKGKPCNVGENNPMYGKHLSEETRKKLSEAVKGYKHTEEAKRNMSNARTSEEWSESNKKTWITRRERYGPTGHKDPEARGKMISKRMKDGGAKRLWEIRRERYGPTGIRQKESV